MLGKLIKYEWRASGRILLPIYGAAIFMGLITSLLFKINPRFEWNSNFFVSMVMAISTILFCCLIAVAIGFSFVISIYRFKKNLLGNEGYLMNTLPVQPWQNIGAKLIVAVIFEFLSVIAAAIAGGLFLLIGSGVTTAELSQATGQIIQALKGSLNAEVILIVTEVCIVAFLEIITANLMIYAAMSIGHSTAEHKIMNSIAVCVGFYIVCQIIDSLLMLPTAFRIDGSSPFPQQLLVISAVIQLVYIAGYFIITNYFFKKKLNLQ